MQQKTPLFFSPGISDCKEKESPVDQAKKTMDALITYNMSFMSRLITATSTEIVEHLLSQFIIFEDIPPVTLDDKMNLQTLKKSMIEQLIRDVRLYEKMKLQFDKGDLSIICFTILFANKIFIAQAQNDITPKKIEVLLSYFLPMSYTKKQTKKIINQFGIKSNKLPVLTEYHILLDLFKTLKPHLSPIDIKIMENIDITASHESAGIGIDIFEKTRLKKKQKRYLDEYLPNPVLTDLIQDFCTLLNFKMTMTSDVHGAYIDLCTKLKKIYLLETKIDELIQADVAQKKNAAIIIEAPAPDPSPKKAIAISLPMEEKNLHPVIAAAETPVINTELLTALETETTITQDNKPLADTVPAVSEPDTNLVEIVEHVPAITTEIQETKDADNKDDEQAVEEPMYIYQPYYKQKENPIQHPQNNTLNLDDDYKDTYLKVFGLIPCESINLRALVNLIFKFGGEIETTGANRCRMKIQNIYAFIAAPAEALERACNSATVTMHGGGHRSTRSQNNDRENAPHFLISQCKDAFTRAGFTPVNLGLDNDPLISPGHSKSKLKI